MNEKMPNLSDPEALLPWYATGTLGSHEAEQVQLALASDPDLQQQYELVLEEHAATIQLNEQVSGPSPAAIETLFALLDHEPSRAPGFVSRLFGRASAWMATLSPRALSYAVGVAVLAIVVQAGLLAGIWLGRGSEGRFTTASVPVAATAGGSFVLIRFVPQASAAEMVRFLSQNRLIVVSGPFAGGLFKVRVAPGSLDKTDIDALLDTFRKDRVVDFIAATN